MIVKNRVILRNPISATDVALLGRVLMAQVHHRTRRAP